MPEIGDPRYLLKLYNLLQSRDVTGAPLNILQDHIQLVIAVPSELVLENARRVGVRELIDSEWTSRRVDRVIGPVAQGATSTDFNQNVTPTMIKGTQKLIYGWDVSYVLSAPVAGDVVEVEWLLHRDILAAWPGATTDFTGRVENLRALLSFDGGGQMYASSAMRLPAPLRIVGIDTNAAFNTLLLSTRVINRRAAVGSVNVQQLCAVYHTIF